ncbi:CRISPR-associated protein [Candidatus Manganitrophus noduliformans]|uniref:CRISPR-associated protein n=1 Tax=Candidatus Manganitrophus noduliformans TaxID=2606439 RepID=A0A7X6DUM8_9BACT|nr:CRISPR-associated protein [Candidatus Manganitrophus noduliformans]NKE73664.1 CRISPR-associated protein [Candidatus Manganitrophus noduliformans]
MTTKVSKPIEQPKSTESPILVNSSDVLFLMDATLTNPNGDPYENIPRRCRTEKGDLGEITGVCLGQTIRGYLKNLKENGSKSYGVFVDRESAIGTSGEVFERFTQKEEDLKNKPNGERTDFILKQFLAKYIDVRLFGALVTVKDKGETKKKLDELNVKLPQNSIQLTGPIQLGALGQTVHPIVIQKIPITSTFRSKEGVKGEDEQEQGTRGEKWIVNYGLYQFTPVIDATLAGKTKMTGKDKDLFVEALWCGIKARVSGSKTNQLPLLYLEVVYEDGIKGRIGRLSDFPSYKPEKEPQNYRDISIDMQELIDVLVKHKKAIKEVRIIEDTDRLKLNIASKLKEKKLIVKEGDSLTGKFVNDSDSTPPPGTPAQ